MNIFEITKEHLELMDLLEENEGELTEEQEQRFVELLKEGEDKVKALYHVYANKRADLVGVKSELERIGNLKKRLENDMARISRMLEMYMKITDTQAIKEGVVDIILAKKTVFEYPEFPKDFIITSTVEKQDLAGFKEWAKDNMEKAFSRYNAIFKEERAIRIK